MHVLNRHQGQTLIETAIILVLLLLIVFGITEFARAWFTKNSLKNAARTGARIAVVTPGISNENRTNTSDPGDDPTVCATLNPTEPNYPNNKVFCYIWTSPGIANGASASIILSDTNIPGGDGIIPNAGDSVKVVVTSNFERIVPAAFFPFVPSTFSADTTMRYE